MISRCQHSQITFLSRNYGTIVNKKTLNFLDLTKKKIALLKDVHLSQFGTRFKTIPVEAEWKQDKPSPIVIYKKKSNHNSPEKTHVYFGGLPALAQATRHLSKKTSERIAFFNDGRISKTGQSGHQAHAHPSEWTTPDCETSHLIKTMLIGMRILTQPSPTDLKSYSYLHFPFSWKQFFQAPKNQLSLYGRCFKHHILYGLNSSNHVSPDDLWLCKCIKDSLNFYETLNKAIIEKKGTPIFKRGNRIYWSSDQKGMLRKKNTWESLGIQCEWMSREEIAKTTLLDCTKNLYVLKIFGDGCFFPDISENIINYLKVEYPNNFEFKNQCAVSKIFVDPFSHKPWGLETVDASGTTELTHLHTFFGSPGHNQVYREGSSKPLWEEIPVSGVSTLWVCTLNRNETLQKNGTQLLPAANLTNLHVTPWNAFTENGETKLLVRVTQGANFNSYIAEKKDLLNMAFNLEQFHVGKWELVSAGSCTRKTTVANVPASEFWQDGSIFLHGLSGIGFSFSGVSPELLRRYPTEITLKNTLSSIAKTCLFYRFKS